MPWASVFDNVWLPLRLRKVSKAAAAPRIAEALALVGLSKFASELSARAVGRHEDARLDRPRAGAAAEAAADGRALRGARRDHALQAQQRPRAAEGGARHHGRVRHPLGLRERLSLDPHRRHGGAPRPRHRRDPDRRARPRATKASARRPLYTETCRRPPRRCTAPWRRRTICERHLVRAVAVQRAAGTCGAPSLPWGGYRPQGGRWGGVRYRAAFQGCSPYGRPTPPVPASPVHPPLEGEGGARVAVESPGCSSEMRS